LYQIEHIKNSILHGHVLNELKKLPSNSINMVFTSPPYWGLRNYNTNPQIWGGDEHCKHEWVYGSKKGISGGTKSEKVQIKDQTNFQIVKDTKYAFCLKCNAWLGELGQEPTHQLFVEHLLLIFNEVKRVLTDDGSCWVNLGDSYSGLGSNTNVPNKSLIGIPDRFKIAMIDSGWICRNHLIWYKRNAMPESVRDRFTIDYEPIYFFTKNDKYYFDQQKEPCVNGDPASPRGSRGTTPNSGRRKQDDLGKHNYTGFNARYEPKTERNVRSVWDIPVQPFRGAHFATFPPKLLEVPIKSACPEDGIVLDIFFGSGTVGLVAKELGRNYLGIELNPEYIEIAKERLS
jgi:site-specific DNA-methyltransferase (cytosine-N4-specific)